LNTAYNNRERNGKAVVLQLRFDFD